MRHATPKSILAPALLAAAACTGSAAGQESTGQSAADDLAADVSEFFASWGPCAGDDCAWDLNGDGTVDERDLALLVGGGAAPARTIAGREGITVIEPMDFIPPVVLDADWSSGKHANDGAAPATAATRTFTTSGTDWVRLRFADFNLGARSRVIVTSLTDGQSQAFTQRTLMAWQGFTAFFTGDAVRVELEVAPGDRDVYVEGGEVIGGIETFDGPLATLCGADNRVASNDARVGRIRTSATNAFCTAWLVSNGAVLTAGHCVDFGAGDGVFDLPAGTVIEFDIPDSTNCGVLNQSAPEDQYPVNTTNPAFDNTAIGQDWAVMDIGPNANGQDPHRARGFFRMTRENPAGGTTIRITGCGDDDVPNGACDGANSDHRTLQTSTGPYVAEQSNGARFWHQYATDTENSNSGSPIIWNSTGVTIGIHTNAGCNPDGTGANNGCSFEHTPLENALEEFPPGATAANTVFVDIGWPDLAAENGTVLRPYDTIANGVTAVPAGGLLSVVEGSYPEVLTITKAMTIDAPVGTVVIGN